MKRYTRRYSEENDAWDQFTLFANFLKKNKITVDAIQCHLDRNSDVIGVVADVNIIDTNSEGNDLICFINSQADSRVNVTRYGCSKFIFWNKIKEFKVHCGFIYYHGMLDKTSVDLSQFDTIGD